MEDILKIKEWINDSDAILIGAGSGLSDAAGLHYSGNKFNKDFKDYIKKYGITDLYTSSFYPFKTEEERWAYWAKHIYFSYYETKETKLYQELKKILKDKNYFIITTNCDGQFINNGFDKKRLFEVQGSYSKLQCEKGCHNKLYDNETLVSKMLESIDNDLKITKELVPKCPVCGGRMSPNLRCDEHFIEDDEWHNSENNYLKFVNEYKDKKILLLEFGVGFNTPGIIRFPFERMVYLNERARLVRFNKDYANVSEEIESRSLSINDDINEIIAQLQ